MRVLTSVGLVADHDAPQVFDLGASVLAVKRFLADAPRTGWATDEETLVLVPAAVRFRIYDERSNDVSLEIVDMGWLDPSEVY